ncbi:hypothetical protein HDU85_004159 [Gaertneriomyces sp. JEL0708]|nr:hypothetical protein HDU85_004159 [Gaertneriomyces sp. JEL0708]
MSEFKDNFSTEMLPRGQGQPDQSETSRSSLTSWLRTAEHHGQGDRSRKRSFGYDLNEDSKLTAMSPKEKKGLPVGVKRKLNNAREIYVELPNKGRRTSQCATSATGPSLQVDSENIADARTVSKVACTGRKDPCGSRGRKDVKLSTGRNGFRQACLSFPSSTSDGQGTSPRDSPQTQLTFQATGSPINMLRRPANDLCAQVEPFKKQLPNLKELPLGADRKENAMRRLTISEALDLLSVVDFIRIFAEPAFKISHKESITYSFGVMETALYALPTQFGCIQETYALLVRCLCDESVEAENATAMVVDMLPENSELMRWFQDHEMPAIPPSVHVSALKTLVDTIVAGQKFRNFIKATKDTLSEMRAQKWSSDMLKKELRLQIVNLNSDIATADEGIRDLDKQLECLLAAENRSHEEQQNDGYEDTAARRAIRRLLSRHKVDETKRALGTCRLEVAQSTKKRNALISQLAKCEKQLAEAEAHDLTRRARHDKLKAMLSESRLLGQDRFGRLYWWCHIRGHDPMADGRVMDASGSLPDDSACGILVEEVQYTFNGAENGTSYDDCGGANEEDAVPMRPKCFSKWYLVDGYNSLVNVYRTLGSSGLLERDLRAEIQRVLACYGIAVDPKSKGPLKSASAQAARWMSQAMGAFVEWATARNEEFEAPSPRIEHGNYWDKQHKLMVEDVRYLAVAFESEDLKHFADDQESTEAGMVLPQAAFCARLIKDAVVHPQLLHSDTVQRLDGIKIHTSLHRWSLDALKEISRKNAVDPIAISNPQAVMQTSVGAAHSRIRDLSSGTAPAVTATKERRTRSGRLISQGAISGQGPGATSSFLGQEEPPLSVRRSHRISGRNLKPC